MVLKLERIQRDYEFRYSNSAIKIKFNYLGDYPVIEIEDNNKDTNDKIVNLRASCSVKFSYGFINRDVYDYLKGLKEHEFRGKDHSELQRLLQHIQEEESGIGITPKLLEQRM